MHGLWSMAVAKNSTGKRGLASSIADAAGIWQRPPLAKRWLKTSIKTVVTTAVSLAVLIAIAACTAPLPAAPATSQVGATPSAESDSPSAASPSEPYNIYFGDLHLHTSTNHEVPGFEKEFSGGIIVAAHRYARDVLHHDFIAITNHDWLLADWMWEVEKEVADEFTDDGVFVSFPAFEWTASHQRGADCSPPRSDYPDWGHRNVYFRSTDVASLLRSNDPRYDTPGELFDALPDTAAVLTIPHHTSAELHPFDWSTFNPEYDRVVELIQFRGSFEEDIVKNGWDRGRVLGVVGGSDNHRGLAGRGGIAAILAPALTREALFDALRDRRAYATTHGDVLLEYWGDGEIQGSVLQEEGSITLSGRIESRSGDISLVELIDNGRVVESWQPGQTTRFEFESVQDTNGAQHYFYVRVTLVNKHRAWSSPIWVNYPTAPTPL